MYGNIKVRACIGGLKLKNKNYSTINRPEMSIDSRESLDHRDPPLFFESRYQDRDLKSLDSSVNIKT